MNGFNQEMEHSFSRDRTRVTGQMGASREIPRLSLSHTRRREMSFNGSQGSNTNLNVSQAVNAPKMLALMQQMDQLEVEVDDVRY